MIEKKRALGILCVLVTAGLLFVGLWPFDTSPKNRAYWLPNEEGLYFDGQNRKWKLSVGGIAYTPSPLRSLKPAPSGKGSFTIDILLKPARDWTRSVLRIGTLGTFFSFQVSFIGLW